MTHVHRALIALALVASAASHATDVRADVMADQKRVLKQVGVKFDNKSNKCTFFKEADAEKALHGPVVYLPSQVDPTNCSWALAKDSAIGINVSRESGPLYPPHDGSYGVSKVRHVAGVGQDAYTYYANAGGGGVYMADVLTSKGVTSVTLPEKAGNAATALAIARTVMNR